MDNSFQYISAAVTDRGLSEKRPQNEDSYLELNQRGLFAVADGVGGAQAGDVASTMAMEILAEAFVNLQQNSDAEEIMKLGIEKANAAIYQMSEDLPSLSTMATTIVALHLSGNIATIGHVGDSRLYRLDEHGNLFRETQDHSVVEEEVRAGRMTAEQAVNHPSRNVISRALGAEPSVEIDMKTIMVEPNNSFLLCSDGITRHIDDAEIREILSSNAIPSEIAQKFREICYSRGAEDNLTAVIVRITSSLAGNFTPPPVSLQDDYEEMTVANARPAAAASANFAANQPFHEEIPTQDLRMSEEMRVHSEENAFVAPPPETPPNAAIEEQSLAAPVHPTADVYETTGENVTAISSSEPVKIAGERISVFETDDSRFQAEPAGSGFFSKLLGSLLFLIVGAIIGAGLHYFWAQANAPQTEPPPQITQIQTDNIPFKAFEDNRRNVDRDPERFIAANAAAPQDSEDFYLLGRAYLLTGKNAEAKQAFTEAKNKLAQSDETNSKMLATEIALALAVINNYFATEAFKKDITAGNPAANGNSANANQ